MTLSFSQENILARDFIRKIHAGFVKAGLPHDFPPEYLAELADVQPKYHSIRQGHRWRAGMKIHFTAKNRTPDMYLFAPVIECTGVQNIEISSEQKTGYLAIWIDGKECGPFGVDAVCRNDGLTNDEFCKFFDTRTPYVFQGQIIHWTGRTYPELSEL